MKTSNVVSVFMLFLMASMLTSCEAIAGIFKAGMSVGAFAVIAVLVLIVVGIVRLMSGSGKNS